MLSLLGAVFYRFFWRFNPNSTFLFQIGVKNKCCRCFRRGVIKCSPICYNELWNVLVPVHLMFIFCKYSSNSIKSFWIVTSLSMQRRCSCFLYRTFSECGRFKISTLARMKLYGKSIVANQVYKDVYDCFLPIDLEWNILLDIHEVIRYTKPYLLPLL